ncbi:MAG: DNA-directed RNA polymerase subunit alpha C-terminal domain-containing protein [Pirellulales bacterium]
MGTNRYPRFGHRLAPETLRELLGERIPRSLAGRIPANFERLCDLDETVWNGASPGPIEELAQAIIARVRNCDCQAVLQNRRLPDLPEGLNIEDLDLEPRTFNSLKRAGWDRRLGDLGGATVAELLRTKAFGARCLVDLLTVLETYLGRETRLDEHLTLDAERLGRIRHAQTIHRDDPRLGASLREFGGEAATVRELVERLSKRRVDPPTAGHLSLQIRRFRRSVHLLHHQKLEEELAQVFVPDGSQRNRKIVAQYFGWDGGTGCTLEFLGSQHGITRERVRQICSRAATRKRTGRVFAPVVDRALAFLARQLPASVENLEQALSAEGLTACGLKLESLESAAGLLGRKPRFSVVSVGRRRLAVRRELRAVPKAVIRTATRATLRQGAATLAEIESLVAGETGTKADAATVLATLELRDDLRWLDREKGWFRLGSLEKHGLARTIEKVLAVAGRIGVAELRTALRRHRRNGSPPPRDVLLEFCRQLPGCRVEDGVILADPPRDWQDVLTGIEATMVGLLKQHGPVLLRDAFESLCLASGMNQSSFRVYVLGSPIIAQLGRGLYGLLGTKVAPEILDGLLAEQRPSVSHSKVLQGFGWSDLGKPWLAYRLSRGTVASGVLSVPAVMKDALQGAFRLRGADGADVGTLVSRDYSAWGLSPLFRRFGGKPGDHLRLTFDLAEREVVAQLDAESPQEELAEAVPAVAEREAPSETRLAGAILFPAHHFVGRGSFEGHRVP